LTDKHPITKSIFIPREFKHSVFLHNDIDFKGGHIKFDDSKSCIEHNYVISLFIEKGI